MLSKRPLIASCALCVITLASLYHLGRLPWQSGSGQKAIAITGETIIDSTPDHPTLLPADKTVDDLGGWKRVSPHSANAVHTYADKIGSTRINVSQQPLPKEFKENLATRIDDLAKSFNASEKVVVGDIPIYIGTSAEGPQSVIFSKNDLLVLIKSSASLTSTQ